MKSRIYWGWSLGLALAVLAFSGGQAQEFLPTNAGAAPAAPEPAPALADEPAADDVVNAPVQPISTAKPLPPSIRPTPAAAEVIKLADSGVDESVVLGFVRNSASTFNLGAEEIIYLNDIGVPSAVVTAMIQRDQVLRQFSATVPPGPGGPRARGPGASAAGAGLRTGARRGGAAAGRHG